MKKNILLLIIFLILNNCSSSYGDEKQEEQEQKIPVRTILLQPQKYVKKYEGTGKIISSQQAHLMFEVPGKIIKVIVEIGQKVKEGDVIAILNNEVYKAKFELAKTALSKAKRDYFNIKDLFKNNAVSEDQLLQSELGYKNAKSDFTAAKYAFESTELKAPFAGTITHINLQEGELFSPGPMPIPPVILSNLENLQLEATVSSKEIIHLKNGQNAKISLPLDSSNDEINGKVSEVGYVPMTMSNSYKVLVDILNSNVNLKLGMLMNFSIEISEMDSVYMISNRYILDDDVGSFIWINDKSSAQKLQVQTGDLIGHEIIINGDLSPGMMVVTDGNRQVKSGAKLKVIQ